METMHLLIIYSLVHDSMTYYYAVQDEQKTMDIMNNKLAYAWCTVPLAILYPCTV